VGWQDSRGIGGSFAVESAAACAWNGWQASYGISGSFRVERVATLRNSAFTYKGKAVKVQEVSKEPGVRYVLEGSVRKTGD